MSGSSRRRPWNARYAEMLLTAALFAGFSGCGGEKGEMAGEFQRAAASGTVKFKGEPIPAGSVVFTNVENGIQSTCPIDDGEYEIGSSDGPVYGKNTVNVIGLDAEGGKALWSGVFNRDVQIDGETYQQEFDIKEEDVKPAKDLGMDEEAPLY